MDNNYESATKQQELSFDEQQKAYYNAMQQIKDEEENKKKAKKKKKLIIICIIILLPYLLIGGFLGAIYLEATLFPESVISNTAINNYNLVSYEVNENTNSDRDDYIEKVNNSITEFVGENDITSEKIQKKLYKQGKKAYKSEAYLGAIQIWEKCAEYEDTQELLNETHYKVAELYKEQQSLSFAASHYKNSNGFSDSAEQAKECNYQFMLYELKEGKYTTACLYAETNELFDYKETRKAYFWGVVYAKCDATVDLVKSAVQMSCKDPSSYWDMGVVANYSLVVNTIADKEALLRISVEHTYSATNSFGGRVTDTYSYTSDAGTISLQGMSLDEAYRVLELSIDTLLVECGYTG
ncbi:MAG: hypothetical protein IJZ16_04255 [Clostridia bacterium]|nr:hypothetical protein [Clostridia bacterium]